MSDDASASVSSNPRIHLGEYEKAINDRLAGWDRDEFARRYWRRDPTLWPHATPEDVASRLGWLELPSTMGERAPDLIDFADEVREDGFQRVVLLGMGGSSLAAEVMAKTFGRTRGHPELRVLDSTHPVSVGWAIEGVPIEQTFFVVSSKSGSTLEPNTFLSYFWEKAAVGSEDPGRQFAAITDPGSSLESVAETKGFRQCFTARPDVGGRYSALTEFGLVPAALAGVPIRKLLERAERMAERCGAEVEASENPGLRLGAALGELTVAGRDKVTFLTSPSLGGFPSWAEQLIAESTGKIGKGIVPVAGEVEPFAAFGQKDVVYAYQTLRGEEDEATDRALSEAESAGTPALYSRLADKAEIGGEFFRWEVAVAAAGAVIGIDPFDQPDVEMAKELARAAMSGGTSSGSGAPPMERLPEGKGALSRWLALARPGDYLSIQAYLAPSSSVSSALGGLRKALRERLRISTTLGFGPRFLHSTGQLHKGGPNSGLFLQLVDDPPRDEPAPPGPMTFGRIVRAQADGDAMALVKRQRRLVRFDVGADAVTGLSGLTEAVRGPASN